ncbi:hypothetical protein M404DRAFT_1002985 [Pisolithus tinctorius Marx 270]|uniref:RBR-type E3 ubiquitin transferase n=1 Tax=Pisolithus tinctorius Marx 270 TaxID=870435 RepID=A0A0C3NKS5_PISTI|nr:hypothetical protein M404DRAFT_1002985 [Pisolithus tinctorius Marx 270]
MPGLEPLIVAIKAALQVAMSIMSTASSSSTPRKPTDPTTIQSARSQTSHHGSTSSASPPTVEAEVPVPQAKIQVISFPGTSQFRVHGVSACGLAALNFARIAFRVIKSSRTFLDALNTIASRETVEEVISICGGWSSDLHLEVEDICKVPLFEQSLKRKSTFYGPPTSDHFRRILRELQALRDSAAVIITRPPEIIACLKVANHPSGKDAFIVFDSHPRPSHPDGTGLVLASTVDGAVRVLRDILHIDEDLLSSPDLQWQAQLLTNCSGHIILAKSGTLTTEQSAVESSLAILVLRSEIKELERQNKALASQNKHLDDEVDELERIIQQERRKVAGRVTYAAAASHGQQNRRSFSKTNAAAGSSRLSSYDSRRAYNGARSIFAENPPPAPATRPMTYEAEENDLEKMQLSFFEEDAREAARDRNMAFQLQRNFDAEDTVLRQQHADLSCNVQTSFKCGICLDEHPEDDAATVEDCGHMVCRSCLKDYVGGKIADHRFPILCPICTAENRQAGQISGFLVEQLGISEEEYAVWIEMELSQFSILLHCRKCNRAAFVDRTDYNDMPNIVCPMGDCSHIWCKLCLRTILIGGPKHSCDGSSELDHLMKEQGWHYCPSCKTPFQKDYGCNHMTCIAPGCNTHFCYRCGELIVRSALRDEVGKAVTAHYRKCLLFEVPE